MELKVGVGWVGNDACTAPILREAVRPFARYRQKYELSKGETDQARLDGAPPSSEVRPPGPRWKG